MLETAVAIVPLIGAGYGFFRWAMPHIRGTARARSARSLYLPVSLTDAKILSTDEELRAILMEIKRDIYLERQFKLQISCPEVDDLEKSIGAYETAKQAEIAEYISSRRAKLKLFEKMMTVLLQKHSLEMVSFWFHDPDAFPKVVHGIVELLTQGNVTGRTKFDIWQEAKTRIGFGIFVFPSELDEILKKANVENVYMLMGPGCIWADELSADVVLRHVIPRILLEVAGREDPLDSESEASALSLITYSVGLG